MRQETSERQTATSPLRHRLRRGLRYLWLVGVTLVAIGFVGRAVQEPLIAGSVGPTLYLFVVQPKSDQARMRNAVIGHGVAIGLAVAMLAGFGLSTEAPTLGSGPIPTSRVLAVALTVALTLLVLEILDAHHAPAAATAILVAGGVCHPGAPLLGLAVGLAITIAVGPLLASLSRDLRP